MRKYRRLALGILIVTVVSGTGLLLLRHVPTEPVYNGQRLSVWLSKYHWPISVQGRHEADEAILQIGTNAIPTLLRMIVAEDSDLKLKLVGLASRQQLIKFEHVPAWQRNSDAREGFRILGARASNAVPELIKLYHGNNASAAYPIVNSLGEIGPAAHSAVPLLLQVVTVATNSPLKTSAIWALGQIHSDPEAVMPVLAKCLQRENTPVRLNALDALQRFGPGGRAATPELLGLLRDSNQNIRAFAVDALSEIYEKPEWRRLITDWPAAYRPAILAGIIDGLGAMGTNAAPAVPALIECLSDPDAGVRASATNALKLIQPARAAKAGAQ